MMERIEVDVPIMDNTRNMSSQEFQTLLTSWYEDKGILAQLRTQLRFKMINVLKNTAIGRDIARKTSQTSISLSKQAINLIVAEFLMRNQCDYSLSIFNTEAGLSSSYSENFLNESDRLSIQFNKENIVNILELIGVTKTSRLCNDILKLYYENNDNNSFLSCLINILSRPCIEKNQEKKHIDLTHETDFIRQVGIALLDSHISQENFFNLIEVIKCLHKNEIQHLEESYKKIKNVLIAKDKEIEHLDKKKKLTEIKLLKIIKDYNALKHHMKLAIKDKLLKEQEIKDLKIINKNQIIELEKDVKISCKLDHCDNSCKDNNILLIQLKTDNRELHKKNSRQTDEINKLQKKYTDLLHDFQFLQKKVSLLNIKVSEERSSSHLNLNTIENDIKDINKEHRYKKIDASDSSDSITTDGVMREAWLRLEQLEKESQDIQDY